MDRKELSKLKIQDLRDILTSLDPLVPIKIRGLNRKYLINRILSINPISKAKTDSRGLEIYLEWISTINRLSHFPLIVLDKNEIEKLTMLTQQIYEYYEKNVTIGSFLLSLPNFLYYLSTINIAPLLDHKQFDLEMEKILSHGRDRPYQEVSTKIITDTLIQEFGVLAHIEVLVGDIIYKSVIERENKKWQKISKNISNIKSNTLYEANAIMRALYDQYANFQREKPCHPYFTFLIQLPQYIIHENFDIKSILFEISLTIIPTSNNKLLEIYGDHCYDRNFLGQHVLPLSKEVPERKYIVMVMAEEVESAIIFSKWSNVEDYIKLNHPNLMDNVSKNRCNQQKYKINKKDSLMIFRASTD